MGCMGTSRAKGLAIMRLACHGKRKVHKRSIRRGWGGVAERGARALDWYKIVFELIDLRSFSNLWYWIMLGVVWSMASHWVLGVPFDMIQRARRDGGQAEQDLEALVRINTQRMLLLYLHHQPNTTEDISSCDRRIFRASGTVRRFPGPASN